MALATRPRPKVHHRKRVAQHHKHTPHYLKAYFPYLPALAIVAVGFIVNQMLYKSDALLNAGVNLQAVTIPTRIEALSGQANGAALAALILIAGLAMGILLFRHWFRIQRTINKGEAFIAKHPLVDVLLVLIVTAGVILSRKVI
jgi:hypothetical protein